MNALALLILEHLDKAKGAAVPESALQSELCRMVRPQASPRTWREVVVLLTRKEMIGVLKDELTEAPMLHIREAGKTYLRR